MLREYWEAFGLLADRVVPDFGLKTVGLFAGVVVLAVFGYGLTFGGPVAVLSGLFLAFFGIPFIIIFRYLDERSLVEIEEIVLSKGTAKHTTFTEAIRKGAEYKTPDGRLFKPGDLIGDRLKRKKWVLYFLKGYRARALLIYVEDSKTPVEYTAPEIPGEVLYKAYTTTTLRKGLAATFAGRSRLGSVALVIGLVIVLLLIVQWIQAGGLGSLGEVF